MVSNSQRNDLKIVIGITTLVISLGGGVSNNVTHSPLMITIDHTKIDEPLFDFPILVHLGKSSGPNSTDTSFVLTELGSNADRKKIAMTTENGTELYVEIEKWDRSNKEAWLWVKVPSISDTQDTVLYLNYSQDMKANTGMVGDTGSIPSENVWSNGFVMVHHFGQNGIKEMYQDSTNREHNGLGGSSSGTPTKISAKIGDGQDFDGIDDWISIPDHDDLSITTTCEFTVSIWWNSDVAEYFTDDPYIHWFGKDAPRQVEYQFVLWNTNDYHPVRWYNFNLVGGLGAGDYSETPWKPNHWEYQTGVTSCINSTHGTPLLYRDAAVHTGTGPSKWEDPYYNVNYQNGDAPLIIGNSRVLHGGDDWFNGKVDELRISHVVRSHAWIKASYYSDDDSLLTFSYSIPEYDPIMIVYQIIS